MTIRERSEAKERLILSPRASFSAESRGRAVPEEPDPVRTAFARDRDRILHCKSFRRLKHKTQVFLATENDHLRTRLTHTLEVSQIARTVARALELNEDLTEAIALAHDLGHTPFGHAGERALDAALRDVVPGARFRHYEQSLRVVEVLENQGRGLNLTVEVRDGISHHSKGRADLAGLSHEGLPFTLEGQCVRLADRIAYIHHDTEDAIRAGLMRESDLPEDVIRAFGDTARTRLSFVICDLISRSEDSDVLGFSPEIAAIMDRLKEFMFARVYVHESEKYGNINVDSVVRELFAHALGNPRTLPVWLVNVAHLEHANGDHASAQAALDYVAGMTDRYALRRYSEITGRPIPLHTINAAA